MTVFVSADGLRTDFKKRGKKTIHAACLAISLMLNTGVNSEAEPSQGSATLVVQGKEGPPSFARNIPDDPGVTCQIQTTGKKPQTLSSAECGLLRVVAKEIDTISKRQADADKALKEIADRQAKILEIAANSALLTSAMAEKVKSLSDNDTEVAAMMSALKKGLDANLDENKKFIAALLKQYEALLQRLNVSIPNLKE